MALPSTAPPPATRRGSVIAGTVITIVGVVVGIVCFVLIARAFSPLVEPVTFQTPGTSTRTLDADEVYNVATSESSPPLDLTDVTVTGPSGQPVFVSPPPANEDTPIETQSGTYTAR